MFLHKNLLVVHRCALCFEGIWTSVGHASLSLKMEECRMNVVVYNNSQTPPIVIEGEVTAVGASMAVCMKFVCL